METTIRVFDIINNGFAMSDEQGFAVFQAIRSALDENSKIFLDWDKIVVTSTRFIFSAIGRFMSPEYSTYLYEQRVVDKTYDEYMDYQIKRGVQLAHQYYTDPALLLPA